MGIAGDCTKEMAELAARVDWAVAGIDEPDSTDAEGTLSALEQVDFSAQPDADYDSIPWRRWEVAAALAQPAGIVEIAQEGE